MRRIEILTGFAGTAVSSTFSAVFRQTGQVLNTRIKTQSDFFKKLKKRMWGRKFRQVHTRPGTAVSPICSAVFWQTDQDFNTRIKMRSAFF